MLKIHLQLLIWLLILTLTAVLWPGWLELGGLGPDLILIFVILTAFYFPPLASAGWAAGAACFRVSLGGVFPAPGWPLTGQVLSLGIMALAVSLFGQKPFLEETLYKVFLVFAGSILLGLIKSSFASCGSFGADLLLILIVAAYTACLTPFLAPFWPKPLK